MIYFKILHNTKQKLNERTDERISNITIMLITQSILKRFLDKLQSILSNETHGFTKRVHNMHHLQFQSPQIISIKHIILNLALGLLIHSSFKRISNLNCWLCKWNKNNNLNNEMELIEFHFIHLRKFSSRINYHRLFHRTLGNRTSFLYEK